MEELRKILFTVSIIFVISCVWKVFNWIWLKPKKLEKYLKEQGIKGTSYKFFYGDLKERNLSRIEALSKPLEQHSHQIGPRVLPFDHFLFQKYGKLALTWQGPKPMVIVKDPDMIRDILSDNSLNIGYTPEEKMLVTIAGYDGEKWTKHRKILTPAFHLDILKMMLPAFHASCSDMLKEWQKLVTTESRELDVWPALHNLTIDAISRTVFNSSYSEGNRIFQLQWELAGLAMQAIRSARIPGFRFLPTKENRKMKYLDRELHSLIRDIVIKKEKAMKTGEAHNNDPLGCLIQSTFRTEDNKDAKNVGITIDEVVQECKFLWLAGKETMAHWLVWTMIVLSMHQDWQQKARDEVLKVFGKDKPDFDRLNQLKIVSTILNEVLRLYCPAPGTGKRTTNKKVKLGNVILPPGVYVWPLTIFVHHDHDLWGKDADEFNPDRFSEGVSKATKSKLSFFPFGSGPRTCVGQNFAWINVKIAITMILQNFSFELSPNYIHAPCLVPTVKPQYGAPLIIHKL
ncbi:Cytochrome p450 [Thalictrum thalictroides]|uniref:Cytochrome p450 n=1 Tax=Thalictrum thalictroides TaxID=46969 RepID=A0A7J6VLM3_THATH|nr:Cytochrome p450 [Thalictrum thalictroides]